LDCPNSHVLQGVVGRFIVDFLQAFLDVVIYTRIHDPTFYRAFLDALQGLVEPLN
jgi:hypothetical protein